MVFVTYCRTTRLYLDEALDWVPELWRAMLWPTPEHAKALILPNATDEVVLQVRLYVMGEV